MQRPASAVLGIDETTQRLPANVWQLGIVTLRGAVVDGGRCDRLALWALGISICLGGRRQRLRKRRRVLLRPSVLFLLLLLLLLTVLTARRHVRIAFLHTHVLSPTVDLTVGESSKSATGCVAASSFLAQYGCRHGLRVLPGFVDVTFLEANAKGLIRI